MKSHLKLHQIPHHTPEWYAFRENGIGGSETGSILNLNAYTSAIEVFYDKTRMKPIERATTEAMIHGLGMEDYIADCWQYWDGTKEGWLRNRVQGNIVRKCRKINGYITNPKYPWLFASVDRLMNIATGANLISGEPIESEKPIECKQLSYFAAKKWVENLPPSYVAQVHQYCLILEEDYAEFAVLNDGNKFEVIPVEFSPILGERIIEETKAFWYQRVMPVRELVRQGAPHAEIEALAMRLEPPATGNESLKDFLKENWEKKVDKVIGDRRILSHVVDMEVLKKKMAILEEEYRIKENQVYQYINQNKVERVDFDTYGHIKIVKSGKGIRLDRRISLPYEENQIEENIISSARKSLMVHRDKITDYNVVDEMYEEFLNQPVNNRNNDQAQNEEGDLHQQ